MIPYNQAVAAAFADLDLTVISLLQSDGKVEDRFRDDLLLQIRQAGLPVQKGGSHRFDLYVPDEWAFELKMMYAGDHAFDLRGSRADVIKLRTAAVGMSKTLASLVSWHEGVVYPRARRCNHEGDRAACIAHWAELIEQIAGPPPTIHERDGFVLFLAEVEEIR